MIALLVLALQAAPTDDMDIVVVAQRLAALEVNVGRNAKGRMTCGLTQSSGNLRLDKRLCKASAVCVRKHGDDAAKVKACVTADKPRLLAQLRRELGR